MSIQQKISLEKNRSLIGRILPTLIDGFHADQGEFFGRTQGDCLEIDQTVWVRGETIPGQIVPVHINEASAYDLRGDIVSGSH